ncbi:hypothetical protein Nepgr_019267 [Nepenthes gracilis]|uniref:Uncharacterized protein n=1 Tax=Nepenthes gracilis TaxID=150966 RepID=A0AAD3SUX7_NEPGR|nr:hypothetical protein Nepgr_019267 [Nepenthes gracilis]
MLSFYRDDASLFRFTPSPQPQTFPTAETTSKIQRAVTLQLIEEDVAVEIGPQSFGIARDNYEDANELHVLDEAIASEVEGLSLSRMEIQRYVIHSLANLQQAISTMNFMPVRDQVLVDLRDPYRFNQTKLPQLLTTTMMDGLPALGLEVNEAVQCAFAKPETTSFVLALGGRKSLLITSFSGVVASMLLLPLSFTWKLSCEREKLHGDHFE